MNVEKDDDRDVSLRTKTVVIMSGLLFLAGCQNWSCASKTSSSKDPSALIWAAEMGDTALAKRLLEEGTDIDALDGHGRTTALGVAASSGSLSFVKLLLSKRADANKGCPLYYAAERGHIQIAKILLYAGAEPNKYRIGQTPSPILAAARGGHLEMVKLLVENGSDMGMKDGDNSSLIAAAENGHSEVVEYLVTKGDAVDLADSDGRTALYRAAANGSLDVVHVLINHGANPDRKNRFGKSPKQIAEEKGFKTIVEIMDGEIMEKSGDTILIR